MISAYKCFALKSSCHLDTLFLVKLSQSDITFSNPEFFSNLPISVVYQKNCTTMMLLPETGLEFGQKIKKRERIYKSVCPLFLAWLYLKLF